MNPISDELRIALKKQEDDWRKLQRWLYSVPLPGSDYWKDQKFTGIKAFLGGWGDETVR